MVINGKCCHCLKLFMSVFKGIVEGNKENAPDQKASSRKRGSFNTQQEAEESAKKSRV